MARVKRVSKRWRISCAALLLCLLAGVPVSMAQQPLMEATLQPTQSSCNLAAYSNRDDITTADSKDCVLCYNVGCSWFDCADLDTDTASDCYDPNDEYRLRTCTKYTFEECKSDYAGAVCTQGGTLLVVLGAILLIMTGFIRYNEYNYELSRKSAEAVQFLEDGSLVDDDRAEESTCFDCDDPSAWYCYVAMFFAGGAMIITGIGLLVAYSILGEAVFDNIK